MDACAEWHRRSVRLTNPGGTGKYGSAERQLQVRAVADRRSLPYSQPDNVGAGVTGRADNRPITGVAHPDARRASPHATPRIGHAARFANVKRGTHRDVNTDDFANRQRNGERDLERRRVAVRRTAIDGR
jgi:hypothetical protein